MEVKKRKPINHPFSQQSLRGYYPILTVGTSLPYIKSLTFVYLVLGLLCYKWNYGVVEHQLEYTHCLSQEQNKPCSDIIEKDPSSICICQINVHLDQIPKDVYIYYSLENYYQNYLAYVASVDYLQLAGSVPSGIVPSGMIANSFFNDSFQLKKIISNENISYLYSIQIIEKGISFKYSKLFKNPTDLPPIIHCGQDLACVFNGTVKPSNWNKTIFELDIEDYSNNGFQNEHFIIWMRIAAFPTFRKIYGKINHQKNNSVTDNGLKKGNYLLIINYSYPVHQFNGKKHIIISNTSVLGGKNYFLCYLFLIIALINVFIVIHFHYLDKKYGKISYEVYQFIRTKHTLDKCDKHE